MNKGRANTEALGLGLEEGALGGLLGFASEGMGRGDLLSGFGGWPMR